MILISPKMRPNFWFLLCGTLSLTLALLAPPAQAADPTIQNYRRAFALVDANHADQAYVYSLHGHDEALNRVLRAEYMAAPNNEFSFDTLAQFIAAEPDWPNLKAILANAEQKIPPNASPAQRLEWFKAHPPVSLIGFYNYIEALNISGQGDRVNDLVLDRWIKGDFTRDEFAAFYARFGSMLDRDAIWTRLDRFLWKNDVPHARQLTPYIDDGLQRVADARLALANDTSNAESLLGRVPDTLQSEPGLMYERLRWRRKNNMDDAAIDLLRHMPANPDHADAWWDERQIMIHRVMQRGDYELAYELAVHHGQKDPKTLVQGEFLAGWLALRFLNEPGQAAEHFKELYDHATTPLSRSRGAYWLGRAAEAENNQGVAEQDYTAAAAYNMTYYGQLAAARLEQNPLVEATPEPAIPAHLRNGFYGRDLIRATEALNRIGAKDRARSFFHAAMNNAEQRVDFALLTELAYRIGRPDLAIETAKSANQKNIMLAAGGYPVVDQRIPTPPEAALTMALIRQESMFNPDAASPVGAQGLMQLMKSTAKSVAQHIGLRFSPQRLSNADYSLRLGTWFLQQQIDGFDGSYILAVAGYNAGPGRVRQWIGVLGDPRQPNVDAIDWVESIPVNETRNYVQRVMENLQVYRARLHGGRAPLMIVQDLRR